MALVMSSAPRSRFSPIDSGLRAGHRFRDGPATKARPLVDILIDAFVRQRAESHHRDSRRFTRTRAVGRLQRHGRTLLSRRGIPGVSSRPHKRQRAGQFIARKGGTSILPQSGAGAGTRSATGLQLTVAPRPTISNQPKRTGPDVFTTTGRRTQTADTGAFLGGDICSGVRPFGLKSFASPVRIWNAGRARTHAALRGGPSVRDTWQIGNRLTDSVRGVRYTTRKPSRGTNRATDSRSHRTRTGAAEKSARPWSPGGRRT